MIRSPTSSTSPDTCGRKSLGQEPSRRGQPRIAIVKFTMPGHRLLQHGEFDGGHGRYAYYDTVPDLGVMIELLEFDSDKEVQPKHA